MIVRACYASPMARPVSVLELTQEERLELQRLAGRKTASQRDGLRARIVLRRAEGSREAEVAEALSVSLTTWIRRECCSVPSKMAENPAFFSKMFASVVRFSKNRSFGSPRILIY